VLGVSFIFRKGVAIFCERKLGMSPKDARKVSRITVIGVTVLTFDVPGAAASLVEDTIDEVARNLIENKIS
jgi:hypothetical protein